MDYDVRKQLLTLAKDTAELVARHLVMAGRLMDEEPESALAHARAARALAGRVGAVREANGLVAYTAGEWAEALTELRTARRITGDPEHLAVMADCERALGRPDRALMVADDPQAASLSPAAKLELLIVSSGARRDMGQAEAAVVSLQVAALDGPVKPWTARLRYAYADALLDAGRTEDARLWFGRTAEADEDGATDAVDRMLELDGIVLEDHEDEEDARAGEDSAVVTPEELHRVAQQATEVEAWQAQAVAAHQSERSDAEQPNSGVAAPDTDEVASADRSTTPDDAVAPLEAEADTPLGALQRALTLSEEAARATGLTFRAAEETPVLEADSGSGRVSGAGSTQGGSPRQSSESGHVVPERPGSRVGGAPPFVEPTSGTDPQADDVAELKLFD